MKTHGFKYGETRLVSYLGGTEIMVFDDIPQTIDCFDCKAEIQPTFNETFDLLEQNGLPTETRNGVESEMDRILEEIAELKTSLNTYTRSKLEAVDPRVPAPSTPAPSAPNQEQTNTLMAAFNGFVAALPTLIEQLKTEDSTDNSTQISENPRDNELVDSPSEPNTGNETTTDPNENDAPKDTEENNDDAEDNNDDENEDDAKRKERERKREAEQREKRKQQELQAEIISQNLDVMDASQFRRGFITLKKPKGVYGRDYKLRVYRVNTPYYYNPQQFVVGEVLEKVEETDDGTLRLFVPNHLREMFDSQVKISLEVPSAPWGSSDFVPDIAEFWSAQATILDIGDRSDAIVESQSRETLETIAQQSETRRSNENNNEHKKNRVAAMKSILKAIGINENSSSETTLRKKITEELTELNGSRFKMYIENGNLMEFDTVGITSLGLDNIMVENFTDKLSSDPIQLLQELALWNFRFRYDPQAQAAMAKFKTVGRRAYLSNRILYPAQAFEKLTNDQKAMLGIQNTQGLYPVTDGRKRIFLGLLNGKWQVVDNGVIMKKSEYEAEEDEIATLLEKLQDLEE